MKPQEVKEQYILLRAEGKSQNTIAKELGISKNTCSSWEKALEAQIIKTRAERLEKLYDMYYMKKDARIRQLGNTLKRIDAALEAVDLKEMSPKELIDYKLKFTAALKEEYTAPAEPISNITANTLLEAIKDLLNRVRAGEVTAEQANKESIIINNAIKAYEQTEIKEKLDALEAAIKK